MSCHSPIFEEGWRIDPTGATHQGELGTPREPKSSRGRHESLFTTGFGDLPCPYAQHVLNAQSRPKQTGPRQIAPDGCSCCFHCRRSEGSMETGLRQVLQVFALLIFMESSLHHGGTIYCGWVASAIRARLLKSCLGCEGNKVFCSRDVDDTDEWSWDCMGG